MPTVIGDPTVDFGSTGLTPLPGPTAPKLAVFNGENPNGAWRLFVLGGSSDGSIIGGWSLEITTANPQTKIYGQSQPNATTNFTVYGLVYEDTVTSVTLAGAGLASTAPVAGSSYTVTPIAVTGNINTNNYAITFNDGMLTVTPAPLTVTGSNATKAYGAANPAFGVSYANFVNGETLATSDLRGNPALTTAAITNSPIGAYDITNRIGTLTSTNYSFASFVDGTLTVNPLPVNLTGTRAFDGANDAAASILTFTTNYDGANLTLTGSALLAGSAVERMRSRISPV